MRRLRTIAAIVACTSVAGAAFVIAVASDSAAGTAEQPAPLGAGTAREVGDMLQAFDAANVEQSIRTLAGFGTRHTLSSQDDPKRGIGAARDWIYKELKKSAARSGGRMTVELQSFITPAGPRVPAPTKVTNVVATLRGSQATSANRMYVVSGHYDSRCTDVLDATCDAPGANDDASGVAAVLEMARVMATHKFDATIVFMAVAGEEQGLLGSTYYAEQAKQQGLDIEGMFTNDIVGSSLGQNGVRDPNTVRLFAEGPPSNETAGRGRDPARRRQRERLPAAAARPLRQGGGREQRDRHAGADHLPPRPLPARRRPHPVPRARLPRGALHRGQRGLPPPAPERPRGERRAVRRPARVRRLRLHRARREGQRGDARGAGERAGGAQETSRSRRRSCPSTPTSPGRPTRSPTSPATRSSTATRSSRRGRTRSPSAT